MIDPRQPRVGQAITGTATLLAFVLDLPAIMPVIAVVLAPASFLGAKGNPYAYLWRGLRKALKIGPPRELEESWPPRFANICGFVFLFAASAAWYVFEAPVVAWSLDLIVAALALLASTTGLCVGCEIYVLGRRVATRGRIKRKLVVPAGDVAREGAG
jgi:hypothetical protein